MRVAFARSLFVGAIGVTTSGGAARAAQGPPGASAERTVTARAAEIAGPTDPTTPDLSAAPAIAPGKNWTYTPDPVTREVRLPHDALDVPGGRGDADHRHRLLCFSAPQAHMAIISHARHVARTADAPAAEQSTIEKIDLATGRTLGAWAAPDGSCAVSLSPRATRAVLQLGRSTGDGEQLLVIDLTANPPEVIASTVPYGAEDKNARRLARAELIDEDHLLTANESTDPRVVLWHLPDMKPVYSLKLPESRGQVCLTWHVSLSPTRKYFVLEDSKAICLFDALTGKPAGTIDHEVPLGPYTACQVDNVISPDGTRLLHKHAYGMAVFALAPSPKLLSTFPKPAGPRTIDTVRWLDAAYVLLNDHYLFDLDKQMIVWTYDLPAVGVEHETFAGRYWVAHAAAHGRTFTDAVRSFELPDPAVRAALEKLDRETLYAVGPGAKVSLDIESPADGPAKRAVTDALTRALAANGMTVADGAPVTLRVSRQALKKASAEYHTVGPGPTRNFDATVTATLTHVAFVVDGRTVWEQLLPAGAPGHLHLDKGESADQAAQAEQAEIVRTGVEHITLPKYVPAPRDPPGFGRTDLTKLFGDDHPADDGPLARHSRQQREPGSPHRDPQ